MNKKQEILAPLAPASSKELNSGDLDFSADDSNKNSRLPQEVFLETETLRGTEKDFNPAQLAELVLDKEGDPLGNKSFKDDLLFNSEELDVYQENSRFVPGKAEVAEIGSRKEKDKFLYSLEGWYADDKTGKNLAARERKQKKLDEKE